MAALAGIGAANAGTGCNQLQALGDAATLRPSVVDQPERFVSAGCVDFPPGAQQGPAEWYRGHFELAVTVTGPTQDGDAADLFVRAGESAVVIASLKRRGEDLVLTSPTVGSEFTERSVRYDQEQAAITFEIDNYLQLASLSKPFADISVGYSDYGLPVKSFEIAEGSIQRTSQPPYEVVLSIGSASTKGIEAVVSLRQPALFDDGLSVMMSDAPDSDELAAVIPVEIDRANSNSRIYQLPHPCESDCSVQFLARAAGESAGGRFELTATPRHRSPISYVLVVAGTASVCAALWLLTRRWTSVE